MTRKDKAAMRIETTQSSSIAESRRVAALQSKRPARESLLRNQYDDEGSTRRRQRQAWHDGSEPRRPERHSRRRPGAKKAEANKH
ncbi:hypothetical protein Ahy_B04g069877 isoform B [Arachis hypogaea]|uniref:Uncharacterized protein n=1 Tax=Arachis hypogaea TaxID=3818 RepID=A0A444ZDS0_ARAHY|nr:hypothetical protein Ahy_B04g069877 isoform B [Arachis hypogaea]